MVNKPTYDRLEAALRGALLEPGCERSGEFERETCIHCWRVPHAANCPFIAAQALIARIDFRSPSRRHE